MINKNAFLSLFSSNLFTLEAVTYFIYTLLPPTGKAVFKYESSESDSDAPLMKPKPKASRGRPRKNAVFAALNCRDIGPSPSHSPTSISASISASIPAPISTPAPIRDSTDASTATSTISLLVDDVKSLLTSPKPISEEFSRIHNVRIVDKQLKTIDKNLHFRRISMFQCIFMFADFCEK